VTLWRQKVPGENGEEADKKAENTTGTKPDNNKKRKTEKEDRRCPQGRPERDTRKGCPTSI
jgi:hypothetical protein